MNIQIPIVFAFLHSDMDGPNLNAAVIVRTYGQLMLAPDDPLSSIICHISFLHDTNLTILVILIT